LLLILGLGSRLIALPLVVDMVVAYITADREALFSIISDPDKFTAAAPFTFLVASLVVLIFGAGWFSLDALVAGRRRRGESGRRPRKPPDRPWSLEANPVPSTRIPAGRVRDCAWRGLRAGNERGFARRGTAAAA